MLIADLFSKEIKDALFSMDPKKSLGLDGFNPELFQKSWHVVSEDTLSFAYLPSIVYSLPKGLNDTMIVMVPK